MFAAGHTPRPHLTVAAQIRAVETYLANRSADQPRQLCGANRFGRPFLPIDRHVPPPAPKGLAFARPFAHMEIGESFFEPCGTLTIALLQSRIKADAKGYSPRRFTSAPEDQNGQPGVRCWRVT